jgi:patatin-like phospholipase/acyl hydrolase
VTNDEISSADRFQVLALEGGGLKGIFAAAALAGLESDFRTRVVEHFDLITGTSTGGLIALGLAAGLTAQEIVDFYLEHGRKIFPSERRKRLRRLRRPYDPSPLRDALEGLVGDATLGDSKVRLAIPSFDLTSNDVYLFRTPHHPDLRRDSRERLVDVGMAATAAPTFLPAHRLDGLRLIDGGVWANNPTMVGVVEALAACAVPQANVHVLTIGTTTEVVHRSNRLDDGSPVWWLRSIVDVAFRGQALAASNHAQLILPDGQVNRLDVQIPRGLHALDRVDALNLMGHARTASRKRGPQLAYLFEHDAVPYTRPGGIE